MRVFVTGATGWVGSAVVKDLIAAGHQVLGLARSDKGAEALTAAGAEVHRGSLEDLDSLRSGAAQSDGVIHTAFNHDFSKFAENCAEDRRAIEAIGAVLEGSDRPLLVTSGVGAPRPGPHGDRGGCAAARLSLLFPANRRRRPPRWRNAAYGQRPSGSPRRSMATAITASCRASSQFAREKGVSAYIGDGLNRWPAVHRLDAARVYRLALERGAAGGPFHAIAEEGVPFKEIAEVIGRRLNIPVVSKSPEEAAEHFGWFAMFAGMDAPTSSERTRSLLGWQPEQPGLIADIDHPAYFA